MDARDSIDQHGRHAVCIRLLILLSLFSHTARRNSDPQQVMSLKQLAVKDTRDSESRTQATLNPTQHERRTQDE